MGGFYLPSLKHLIRWRGSGVLLSGVSSRLFLPCGHTANPHGHRATLRNCPFILGSHRQSQSAMQLLGSRVLVSLRQSVLSFEIPFNQQTRSGVASESASIKDKFLPKSLIKNAFFLFRKTSLTTHYSLFPFPNRGLHRAGTRDPQLLRTTHESSNIDETGILLLASHRHAQLQR